MEIPSMSKRSGPTMADEFARIDFPQGVDWREAVAFGVFASGAMRAGADLTRCRRMWGAMPLEDRARWLQRGRDTITYALGYVP